MSPTLVIVLIVVVWLFVLAPWLLRGQRPISKAGEAFDETRVVYSGGSGELPTRKRPKLTPQDVHTFADREESLDMVEGEPVDEVLIEDDSSRRIDSAVESMKSKLSKKHDSHVEAAVVDGHVVQDLPKAKEEPAPAETEDEDFYFDDEEREYALDDAYTSPGDLLYPGEQDELAETETAELPVVRDEDVAVQDASDDELTDEDREFAARRAHRGGWDPEADEQAKVDRYQRRSRTLMGLGAAALLTLILGFVIGGWAWLLPAAVFVFGAVYLYALRQQVQAEERLRARRVAQLRRARLGVRNEHDDSLGIPQRLRRPGAVVLELDDESPDFEDLDTVVAPRTETEGGSNFTDDRRAG